MLATAVAPPCLRPPARPSRSKAPAVFCSAEKASKFQAPKPTVPTPERTKQLPLRVIPGDYGPPFLGALQDRWDFFYTQGREEFFKSRMDRYESTVFRANMPPGPFISSDPRVVVLLDGKSFPVLFDNSIVEKKDVFTGTYMPSLELTGGYRVLSYLDPSNPNHKKLKNLLFFLQTYRRDKIIPEFHATFSELFDTLETEVAATGKAAYSTPGDQAAFNFLARAFFGTNPVETELGSDGPRLITMWVLFQLGPVMTLGLPPLLDDLLLHTFPLPPALVKGKYQRLYEFFYKSSKTVFAEAEKQGISKEEACNNLVFATCFNSFGGLKLLFPNIVKCVGLGGPDLQTRLAQEIRSAVKSHGGKITMAAMEAMPLMKSVVYEALRIEPPVPYQYGRAKRDVVIESHDAAFEVKRGEMLFGFQPFATKDPKIFERPGEFVPERFVGDGEALLKHVLWSNGPETESPTVENKQCAGKDFVVFASRLLVVELFLRYDSFEVEVAGTGVSITALNKASF